jgi:hypothetical protein
MQRKVTAVDRGGQEDGGHGRGWGRGRGHCGHGRRGRSRGGRDGKPLVSARNFTDEEWPQFSGEEQPEVGRLKDGKKRKRATAISSIRSAADAADADEGS